MKKIIIFLMSIMTMLGLFVGCASNENSSSPKSDYSASDDKDKPKTETSPDSSHESEDAYIDEWELYITVGGIQKKYTFVWYKNQNEELYAIGKIDGIEDGLIWTTTSSSLVFARENMNVEGYDEQGRQYYWEERIGPNIVQWYGPY